MPAIDNYEKNDMRLIRVCRKTKRFGSIGFDVQVQFFGNLALQRRCQGFSRFNLATREFP